MEICAATPPEAVRLTPSHSARCVIAGDLYQKNKAADHVVPVPA
jgi:hypothetical protein